MRSLPLQQPDWPSEGLAGRHCDIIPRIREPLGRNDVTAEGRARGWQSPIEGLAVGPLCYSHLTARGRQEGRQGSWPPCSGRALGELGGKSVP